MRSGRVPAKMSDLMEEEFSRTIFWRKIKDASERSFRLRKIPALKKAQRFGETLAQCMRGLYIIKAVEKFMDFDGSFKSF